MEGNNPDGVYGWAGGNENIYESVSIKLRLNAVV